MRQSEHGARVLLVDHWDSFGANEDAPPLSGARLVDSLGSRGVWSRWSERARIGIPES
jgi:hypothetical protein